MRTLLVYLTLPVLIFFYSEKLSSQTTTISISGKIVDEQNSNILPFANIMVINSSDSTYVSGTVTDESGYFKLSLPLKSYLLRISFLGYETYTTSIDNEDLGVIYLKPKDRSLADVVVTATSKIFRMESGGISVDIQNSPLRNMGVLSDVLGQLPFVLKDQESYTIFGKGAPLFYINNRQVRNNSELQQISSKDIKAIKIITNPGAEYDASVNAIIKIETIRPIGDGLSGNIYTYNRYNKKFSNLDRVSFNYRNNNLDIFTGLQYATMSFPKDRNISNLISGQNNVTTINSKTVENDGFDHLIPELGFNYIINNKNSLGARYEYVNQFDSFGKSNGDINVFQNNVTEDDLHSIRKVKGREYSHYLNTYLNTSLSSLFSLKLDIDYKTSNRKNNANIQNTSIIHSDEEIVTSENGNSELIAGKLTMNTPLYSGALTYGLEMSYTTNKQVFSVYEDSNVPGVESSNNRVKQNLGAGFLSYGKTINKFSGDIGFRYESVRSKYFQNNELIEEQSKNYQKFFPSLRLSYKNDNLQMELAYKNIIQRPYYYDLRSTVFYQAPYSYYSGNPLLKPTYQNNFTYMMMWKKFTLMTIYTHYKDRIAYIPQLYLENSILLKPINFNNSQRLSISLNYSNSFGIWKPNWEISLAKDYLKLGNPSIKYNKPIFATNLRNHFQLKDWQLGVDIRISSEGNANAEYLSSSWQTNLYINKSFLHDKLMLNISSNDLFNTSKYRVNFISNNLATYYDNKMYRQNIQVSITYRFNNTSNRYKGSRSSDELDRL